MEKASEEAFCSQAGKLSDVVFGIRADVVDGEVGAG